MIIIITREKVGRQKSFSGGIIPAQNWGWYKKKRKERTDKRVGTDSEGWLSGRVRVKERKKKLGHANRRFSVSFLLPTLYVYAVVCWWWWWCQELLRNRRSSFLYFSFFFFSMENNSSNKMRRPVSTGVLYPPFWCRLVSPDWLSKRKISIWKMCHHFPCCRRRHRHLSGSIRSWLSSRRFWKKRSSSFLCCI